jgi:L-ascorbate metabolism protein UlaG (beta-lactamase superfamily)
MSVFLGARGIESIGMNTGGTVEAAGVRFTMVHADHSGGATLGTGADQVTRDLGCWGWVIDFEDGTTVYHSGDTDLFGDMNLVRERHHPEIAVLPIGGHYTMGPRDAGMALDLIGASAVIPIHYGTFPILAGTPAELRDATSAEVVELEPGETWEAQP